MVKTILWRDCRHHKRDGLRVNQHLYFTNFKKRSVLFNTMVLAALVSNAPLIFFFFERHWTTLQMIYSAKSGFFHRDMNLVFQQFKYFPPFLLLPLSLIMLYYSSHSKAKKDNPTTSSSNLLTGKNRNNSINSSWGSKMPRSFS